MHPKSIWRWINELSVDGIVCINRFNEKRYDKTNWYAINWTAYIAICEGKSELIEESISHFKKFQKLVFDSQNEKSISQNKKRYSQNEESISQNKEPIPSLTISSSSLTISEPFVETSLSTVVVHDQVDEIGLQVHDVIDNNAALLPQLDVDEGKEKISKKRKGSAAAKNPDPTPINAMWDILLEQSAKIGNDEPQFMPRYGRDFKLLYAILKQRAEKRNEPITDQVEPFRRYVTKIVDYIIKGRKVPQHQFTANNLARNFNPGYLHTSFNQICATIQSGVTVTNQPNKPTTYNESEVYRNFDSSQAAF